MSDRPAPQTAYLDAAIGLLARVRDEEAANVSAAADVLADAVASGARIFAYGAGHSALPAQDLVYRAGGLALVNLLAVPGAVGVEARPAVLGSRLERVAGLADAVLDTAPLRPGDVLIIVSLSGRNTLPVELAHSARERGLTVIGVTSLAYARESTPSNALGAFLADHCDVVIDSKVAVGDAELTAPGVPAPFAPASTVVTCAVLQAVTAEAAARLAARGVEPPVLRSGNVAGGLEWNARVFETYADRIFYNN
jgi:uncharacterized phosphosugar-binding protein